VFACSVYSSLFNRLYEKILFVFTKIGYFCRFQKGYVLKQLQQEVIKKKVLFIKRSDNNFTINTD